MAPNLHSFPGLVPNQSVNYGTPLTSTLQFVHGPFMNDRWTNFGPSIGFALDPFKDGKDVDSRKTSPHCVRPDQLIFVFLVGLFRGCPA